MTCSRCGASLEAPVQRRRRVWESGFPTRAAANKRLTELLARSDKGGVVEQSAITLREFVEDQWLPSIKASDLRPSTVEMYERTTRTYLLARIGSLRLRDVTPTRLCAWLDDLKSAGTGVRTVEIAGITAHKILKSALDRELTFRNVADNAAVRAARPKAKAAAPTVWTAEETRKFLDSRRAGIESSRCGDSQQ